MPQLHLDLQAWWTDTVDSRPPRSFQLPWRHPVFSLISKHSATLLYTSMMLLLERIAGSTFCPRLRSVASRGPLSLGA